jgi:hypothetical protein
MQQCFDRIAVHLIVLLFYDMRSVCTFGIFWIQ